MTLCSSAGLTVVAMPLSYTLPERIMLPLGWRLNWKVARAADPAAWSPILNSPCYNYCMQFLRAGEQQLIFLELDREVIGGLVKQANFECNMQEEPRRLVLE